MPLGGLATALVMAGCLQSAALAQTAGAGGSPAGGAGPANNVAAGQLPTGGQVSAGQASISQSGNTLTVNQTSQRAVVDWNSFNVGKDAQVHFQQPNAQSATLNRVSEMQPSQIFGRITAPGQVVLVNPQGVYFGKSSSLDVGGLVASTHNAVNDEFMNGQLKLSRQGATGSVVNEGELRAALSGYIALLAPEVRNSGVIVANLGTVALAAGEAYELKFDGNGALSNVRVTPAAINTLVENNYAIQAPGGLVILSAQAASRLQTAVVSNAGRIEATGLISRAGRILLEATTKVLNSGVLRVDATAGANGGPAGSVSLNAPVVENSGTVSAANNLLPDGGQATGQAASVGRISIEAEQFTQTATGVLDVSALYQAAGSVTLQVSDFIYMSGSVLAYSQMGSGESAAYVLGSAVGGQINLAATRRIDFDGAVLDASGPDGAGRIHVNASGSPADTSNNQAAVRSVVALLNQTVLRVNSQRAVAGRVGVEGDDISLDATRIEAMGATGGGVVLVGGDWQGGGTMRVAKTLTMSANSSIDASATDNGNGGQVVLLTDVNDSASTTSASGLISAKGGQAGGHGGQIETSGYLLRVDGLVVDASAATSHGGEWLLDPYNITITSSADNNINNASSTITSTNTSSNINVSSITSALNNGTSVTVQTGSGGGEVGDLQVNTSIAKTAGGDASLTLKAHNNVVVSNPITSSSNKLHVNLIADTDKDGAGVVIINSNLTSNGGNIAFGDGSTIVFGGATTLVGGDVYVQGSSTVTWSSAGGNITINGQTLIGNPQGLSVNSSGGNVTFSGTIDSANQYASVYVSAGIDWTNAKNAAASGTGNSTGDTYLATVTSRLENAIAGQAVNYQSSWLGARRVAGIGTDSLWRWVTGPEALQDSNKGLAFSNQSTSGGASSYNGYFNNWSSGEPNNWTGSSTGTNLALEGESVIQFTGSLGKWNDLPKSGATLTYYVKETNATPSPLTINAGSGSVSLTGAIGGSKTLSDLTITAGNFVANQTNMLKVSNDILLNAPISKTSGTDATLTFQAARHLSFGGNTTINATSNKLNLVFNADTDKSGDGFVKFSGPSITTNGGYLQFGIGDTATLNGATVYVGGDVYFDGTSAQSVNTGGGAMTVYGEALVANTLGLSIDSAGGNITFKGVLNSANQYVGVYSATALTWIESDAAAAAVSNSYLATITSRLENSLAALAGSYNTAWIGGRRLSNGTWRWERGPEAGQAFTYTNWASGEPNNCCTNTNGLGYVGENATQFTGTNGNWNDLFDNGARGAIDKLNYYIRETTINSAPLTITAGAGNVTFEKAVGTGKALANLAVTGNQITFSDALRLDSTGATITSTGASTIVGTISGSGNLTKAGASTLTLNGANSYTGATVINAGSLVIENNAPTFSTSGYSGAGSLVVQSAGAAFTSPVVFDKPISSLAGLRIGKTTNTSNVSTLYGLNVGGAVSIYGGNLYIASDLASSSGGNLLLQSTGDVVMVGNVSTSGTFTANAGAASSFVMGMNFATGAGSTINANAGVTLNAGTSYLAGSVTSVGTGISVTGNVQIANLDANPSANPVTLSSGDGNVTLTGGTVTAFSGTVTDYALLSLNKGKSYLTSGAALSAISGTNYALYQFSAVGSDSFFVPYGVSVVEYLLVGAGGGGGGGVSGNYSGGNGGGGGVYEATLSGLTGSQSLAVTVGAAGAQGNGSTSYGTKGGDSGLDGLWVGGGGGGGASGGSGGGYAGLKGTGNNNVAVAGRSYLAGGGGGSNGAGAVGGTGTFYTGGTGLRGSSACVNCGGVGGNAGGGGVSSFTGTSVTYGSGAFTNTPGSAGYNANYPSSNSAENGLVAVRFAVGGGSRTAGSVFKIATGAGALSFSSNSSGLSNLILDTNSDNNFAGLITGTGGLTKDGSGTLSLLTSHTYSGTTTINAGTLQVGNGGANGSLGTGDVVNNAALVFNLSGNTVANGAISGTGTLTKLGAGSLALIGANT